MDASIAKAATLLITVAMFVLRAPHIRRSTQVPVVRHAVGAREYFLVTLVTFGLLVLPLLWIFTPLLDSANYSLELPAFACGVLIAVLGLWLLQRTHVELGRNWSNTLQIREGHVLVSHGTYGRLRHPMYTALLLHALGQALFLPNWIAGPAYLIAFGVLVLARVGPEERLMHAQFGAEYDQYRARTRRLIPGVW